jgi:hypothetical protein
VPYNYTLGRCIQNKLLCINGEVKSPSVQRHILPILTGEPTYMQYLILLHHPIHYSQIRETHL